MRIPAAPTKSSSLGDVVYNLVLWTILIISSSVGIWLIACVGLNLRLPVINIVVIAVGIDLTIRSVLLYNEYRK